MTFSLEERANNTNTATGPGHPTATIRRIGQAGRLSLRATVPPLRGDAALSMVVFGQGKKMGAAFSILYLHGEAYPIFDKEVLP